MGTVPAIYTWQAEEIPDFRQMEARIASVLDFLLNPPVIRLRKTATQSIPNSSSTPISWDLVEMESVNMWDLNNPTKITPSIPGWYIGTFGLSYVVNGTGYREFDIRKNNSATDRCIRVKFDPFASGSTVGRGTIFVEQFNGTTDYVEAMAWQNSGAALAISVPNAENWPDFNLRWFATL
jgi:hypothetical protein